LGDLVNITAGVPTPITATPTTTAGAATPVGVFVGVRYTDATLRQEQHAQYLPANAITAGVTKVFIQVVDDPDALFMVQANAPITRSQVGMNATLTNFSAGNTQFGVSKVQLNATTPALTATFAVRIVDLVDGPMSTAGDAYTDCIVKFNVGVHAYNNGTGQ
ncbi:MAG: hypothetical protein ACYC1K_03615, partial [Minisyncoccota bacterium]